MCWEHGVWWHYRKKPKGMGSRRPTLSGTPWRPRRSSMELHEPPWRHPRNSMSLHGDFHGPPRTSVELSRTPMEASMEEVRGGSMELRGGLHGDLHEASTDLHGDLHGAPRTSMKTFMETSTELPDLHGAPWRPPRSFHGASTDLHGDSMDFRGAPWASMELHGGFHGAPNNVGNSVFCNVGGAPQTVREKTFRAL